MGKVLKELINDYSNSFYELDGVSGEITNQIMEFGKYKNREKIIKEYLKYYPGERTRIESVPKRM